MFKKSEVSKSISSPFLENKHLWNVPNPLSLDNYSESKSKSNPNRRLQNLSTGTRKLSPRDSFVFIDDFSIFYVSSSICRAKMVLSAFEFPSAPVVFGHPLSVPRCRWCAPPSRSWPYKIDEWLDDMKLLGSFWSFWCKTCMQNTEDVTGLIGTKFNLSRSIVVEFFGMTSSC